MKNDTVDSESSNSSTCINQAQIENKFKTLKNWQKLKKISYINRPHISIIDTISALIVPIVHIT